MDNKAVEQVAGVVGLLGATVSVGAALAEQGLNVWVFLGASVVLTTLFIVKHLLFRSLMITYGFLFLGALLITSAGADLEALRTRVLIGVAVLGALPLAFFVARKLPDTRQ